MQLAFYALIVLVVIALDFIVVFNFLRYRFKGDSVPLILFLFAFLFVGSVATTLLLLTSTPGEILTGTQVIQFQ